MSALGTVRRLAALCRFITTTVNPWVSISTMQRVVAWETFTFACHRSTVANASSLSRMTAHVRNKSRVHSLAADCAASGVSISTAGSAGDPAVDCAADSAAVLETRNHSQCNSCGTRMCMSFRVLQPLFSFHWPRDRQRKRQRKRQHIWSQNRQHTQRQNRQRNQRRKRRPNQQPKSLRNRLQRLHSSRASDVTRTRTRTQSVVSQVDGQRPHTARSKQHQRAGGGRRDGCKRRQPYGANNRGLPTRTQPQAHAAPTSNGSERESV